MLKSRRGSVDTRAMDAYWPPLLAAALVFAVFSVAAAWWHRRRVAHLKKLLAEAEDSRFAAETEALELKRQLQDSPTGHDLSERRTVLERALAPPARPRAGDPGWLETQPMTRRPEVQDFAPTQPMPEPRDG